jgi:DNA-binding MarR family transcriptional regulator
MARDAAHLQVLAHTYIEALRRVQEVEAELRGYLPKSAPDKLFNAALKLSDPTTGFEVAQHVVAGLTAVRGAIKPEVQIEVEPVNDTEPEPEDEELLGQQQIFEAMDEVDAAAETPRPVKRQTQGVQFSDLLRNCPQGMLVREIADVLDITPSRASSTLAMMRNAGWFRNEGHRWFHTGKTEGQLYQRSTFINEVTDVLRSWAKAGHLTFVAAELAQHMQRETSSLSPLLRSLHLRGIISRNGVAWTIDGDAIDQGLDWQPVRGRGN